MRATTLALVLLVAALAGAAPAAAAAAADASTPLVSFYAGGDCVELDSERGVGVGDCAANAH